MINPVANGNRHNAIYAIRATLAATCACAEQDLVADGVVVVEAQERAGRLRFPLRSKSLLAVTMGTGVPHPLLLDHRGQHPLAGSGGRPGLLAGPDGTVCQGPLGSCRITGARAGTSGDYTTVASGRIPVPSAEAHSFATRSLLHLRRVADQHG